MYDNPLTPSPSNLKIFHLKLYYAIYLRCNFFTPFTRVLFHTHGLALPSSVFYRLIKMRMNIIIVVLRPSDSKNLLWTVFFILFLFVVRRGLCLYILPKINELIMQLPHNFKQSFLFCSIIFYYYVCTMSQVYFVHKLNRFVIVQWIWQVFFNVSNKSIPCTLSSICNDFWMKILSKKRTFQPSSL